MQIPSVQPFQPPARPTKIYNPTSVSKSRDAMPTDRTAESNAVSDDPFSTGSYEPIQQAMNNLPDSRADVVARGKALAADPTYPALKIISQLANLFVADAQASLIGDN